MKCPTFSKGSFSHFVINLSESQWQDGALTLYIVINSIKPQLSSPYRVLFLNLKYLSENFTYIRTTMINKSLA